MTSKIRFLLIFLIAAGILPLMPAETVSAQAMKPAPPAFVEMLRAEMHRNVGKVLPEGITVIDNQGKSVDLRSTLKALHSPVILVGLTSGCLPCKKLLDNIREYPDVYKPGHGARLAILQVLDTQHVSLSLPAGVLELHISGKLDTGFLASQRIPEAFVFDRHLKLIKRRVGVTPNFLSYPAGTPTKDL